MKIVFAIIFSFLISFSPRQPTLGVSASNNAVLYVILGPVGPYFASGFKPVSLLADPSFIRAWRGGCGFAKMGANYAPTVMVQVRDRGGGRGFC